MDAASLRGLAAEREARQRKNAGSEATPPAARASKPAGGFASLDSASIARAIAAGGSTAFSPLKSAHRSVRLARSLGLAIALLALLIIGLLFRSPTWTVATMLACLWLARSGGAWLHGVLPATLREGGAPADASVITDGAFASPKALLDGGAWAMEWEVALENLAFVCTYGKKNCLTNSMYSGELTLGKVCRLVGGKLSEGVVRC